MDAMKQIILKLICLSLLFLFVTPAKAEEMIEETSEEINTLYEEYFEGAEFPVPEQPARRRLRAAAAYTTVEEAAAYLKEQMKQRSTTVALSLNIPRSESETAANLAKMIFHKTFEHTGVSTEGDYIRYHYLEYKCNMKYLDDPEYYSGTFTYTITYMTDTAMEDEVTAYLQDVYEELGLPEQTEIEKIRRIYDYICSHTAYDNEHDSSYKLKYSAYAALIDGLAVCQGYSALFYRMALDNGLDCRVISGKAGNVNHAWNCVRLGDRYYLLDATWDAGSTDHRNFLLCEEDLTGHHKDMNLFGPAFDAVYPPAEKSYVRLDGLTYEDTVYYYETGTVRMPVSFDPKDATVRSLHCVSDDESVVSVKNSKLILKEEGSTDIHIRTDDGYHTADITVVITFAAYDLSVTGGSGSGTYHDHEEVTITAEVPEGHRFVRWEADFETDADLTQETVTFRMPAADCSLKAVTEEIPEEEEPEEEPGWKKDAHGRRYLNEDGTYSASMWQQINGEWYYFDADTYMHTGWLTYEGSRYYLEDSGVRHTGWGKISGSWYYFRENGVMHTGWLKWNGKKYYLGNDGRMHTGWLKYEGEWYYMRSSGSLMRRTWAKIGGSWYYFRESGVMHTGWLKWNEKWYYLKGSGKMHTGWLGYDGKWYYMRTTGSMMRRWAKISGSWYYFRKSGAMHTGWLKWKNRQYYLKDTGRMATGRVSIGNRTYTFSENGALVK